MYHTFSPSWPALEAAYTDEFGVIDPEVYHAARQIWPVAEKMAVALLRDAHTRLSLLLKAVAVVSRVHNRDHNLINDLPAYLYRTYKRLVWAEFRHETRHREQAVPPWASSPAQASTEETLARGILIRELMLRMDDWTREVFRLRVLGYQYAELVPRYGSATNVIRSKFSKAIAELAQQVHSER